MLSERINKMSLAYLSPQKIKIVGSCNFCNRGTLLDSDDTNKMEMVYPYSVVYVLRGSSPTNTMEVRICRKCLLELKSNQI